MKISEILQSDDILDKLQLELWLRHTFDFTDDVVEAMVNWLGGEDYEDVLDNVLQDLIDHHFAGEIPYGVVKDGDPITADEWVHQHLLSEFRSFQERL